MKYILLAFLSSTLLSCTVQFIPNEIENGKLLGVMPMKYSNAFYQVTNKTDGTREQNFRQARKWAAFNLPSAATALSVSDNMIGDVMLSRILEKQVFRVKGAVVYLPTITYAISIESMEGYYRATASNFQFVPTKELKYPAEVRIKGTNRKRIRQYLQQVDTDVQTLLSNLSQFIPGELIKETVN